MDVVEKWGTLPLLFKTGKTEVKSNLKQPMTLFARGLDGKRLFEIPMKNGVFTADNFFRNQPALVYE